MPKWLSYTIILGVPLVIISTVLYFTYGWPINSVTTIIVWFVTWLVSMMVVTVLYMWLIIGLWRK
ncbi:hypothetical protein LOSG293_011420 [Secundilactobacillus oryzae JCM 18671]|uniref:Uncharacterized protein n=1 Tax=Secundilactobacillus oryzae JCM 18671 TaxID=1291743 RepID=A0A081BG73_9LACO|nr:hypothetical protein [Secundilactobacillus oryzae]GAK47041.1 hypothetical protein LOSG293_011420 [Secundilactobacillus oryzae JCM 18671]